MDYFPLPYPDELLYSTIARAGVHSGILSPKELLEEVFQNRKVIATPDLPNHISTVASQYPFSMGLDSETLTYRHTLFPIYAPFVPELRRRECLEWMKGRSQGAQHLALGLAASKVKANRHFRYCPDCLKAQLEKYGEYFWCRRWQVVGADVCPIHGRLIEAKIQLHDPHRHQFFAASPNLCPSQTLHNTNSHSFLVSRQIEILLNTKPAVSPTYAQWTAYYRHLVVINHCDRGDQVDYQAIKDRVLGFWSQTWLTRMGLQVTDDQSCWLRAIFRKHRKSFSYLQHLILLSSFLKQPWSIEDVLISVRNTGPQEKQNNDPELSPLPAWQCEKHRVNWLGAVTKLGVKQARLNGYGDCYAWLYRHDNEWLLRTNKSFKLAREVTGERVDWYARDRSLIKALRVIMQQVEEDLWLPRISRNWLINALEDSATVEKNLHQLPLTHCFLNRYSETIEEYQIRRIGRVLMMGVRGEATQKRCYLLRVAGLSEERLRPMTKEFLKRVTGS